MLNPQHISRIVNKTINDMGYDEPGIKTLIKGTFAIESDLTDLFDYSNPHYTFHGFMMLSSDDAHYLFNEYIPYKPVLLEKIENATGIHVQPSDTQYLIEELDYNIAFMVAVTYAFYEMKGVDFVDDSLETLAKLYIKYFAKDETSVDEEDFIQIYRETFIN